MKKNIILTLTIVVLTVLNFSCKQFGGKTNDAETISKMMFNGEMPNTWANEKGDYFFFRKDGLFSKGGNEGESSIKEGKWIIESNIVKIQMNGEANWKNFDFAMDKGNLILNDTVYQLTTH